MDGSIEISDPETAWFGPPFLGWAAFFFLNIFEDTVDFIKFCGLKNSDFWVLYTICTKNSAHLKEPKNASSTPKVKI